MVGSSESSRTARHSSSHADRSPPWSIMHSAASWMSRRCSHRLRARLASMSAARCASLVASSRAASPPPPISRSSRAASASVGPCLPCSSALTFSSFSPSGTLLPAPSASSRVRKAPSCCCRSDSTCMQSASRAATLGASSSACRPGPRATSGSAAASANDSQRARRSGRHAGSSSSSSGASAAAMTGVTMGRIARAMLGEWEVLARALMAS
mmetsp:Transcript_5113/g.13242  ORF Transcript_5113/g.13242 Transcript_5113/m.13242 type:complete len:212 (-) Transcript_5113:1227-1862(-)